MSRRLGERVARRYREEVRKLQAYWPAESVTVAEAAAGRKRVRLHSGDTHFFDDSEVEDVASRVPVYMRELARLPILFMYHRDRSGARYLVLGDQWQRRLVEILLRGEFSYDGVRELRVSEFIELARRYRSLIFVRIGV